MTGRPPAQWGGLGRAHRGTITRIDPSDGVPRVELELYKGREFKAEDYTKLTYDIVATASPGSVSVTVTTADLERGDKVLVVFVGPDECVIVGRKV